MFPAPRGPGDDDDEPSASRVLGLAPQGSRWRRRAVVALVSLAVLSLAAWGLGSRLASADGAAAPGVGDSRGFDLQSGGATSASPSDVFVELAPDEVSVDEESGLRLEVWSGNNQLGREGRRLRDIIAVALRDRDGLPVDSVPITFRVAQGGGAVGESIVLTNSDGFASTRWTLGGDDDSLLVVASVPEMPALAVTFRARLDDSPGFTLPTPAAPNSPVAAASESIVAPAPVVIAPVPASAAETRLAAGGVHTCVLPAAGVPRCWGRAPDGPGATASRSATPLPVVRSVSLGVLDACVVTADAAIFCWRAGSPPTSGVRANLPAGIAAVQVVAGADHRCALSTFGSAYCWGANTQGQLGNGTTADSDTTLRVPDLPTVTSLAAGWLHTCALTRAGAAFCWGSNASGQLGGGAEAGYGPMRVATTERLVALSAGSAHTCALTSAGVALCWGANAAGQLGRGSAEAARAPVAVAGERAFRSISAGGTHTCALDLEGAAWCWGGNTFGQLGDGGTASSRAPRAVAGGRAFARIVAGGAHTCAETEAGEVWCWGANLQGQLGDGTVGNQFEPVRVVLE